MIQLATWADRQAQPDLIDQMFRGRTVIFRDRLGWDVKVVDGREMDDYDLENPLYLISVDDCSGAVRGSLRLMPTTGRTLLKEVFAPLFPEPVDLVSSTIWEGTRFCVHPGHDGELTSTGIHLATSELFLGMCEVGIKAGLTQIIGVFDQRMVRIYRRIGWSPDVIGRSDRFPHGPILVGLWDVCEQAADEMRRSLGITGNVIRNPDLVKSFV